MLLPGISNPATTTSPPCPSNRRGLAPHWPEPEPPCSDWPRSPPPCVCARCRLHFVGRGRRRTSVGDTRRSAASWSVLAGCLIRASSLPGKGRRPLRREAAAAVVPSVKSLGLLSGSCAEDTQMLASAPRLNSADRPMKTSVLRQRRGSARKQHLGSWAWQQGRGQAVRTLHSGQQTER